MVFNLLNFVQFYSYFFHLYLILFTKILLPYFHLDLIPLLNFILLHSLLILTVLVLHLLLSWPFHYNHWLHFQKPSYLLHQFNPYNLQINQNFHHTLLHYFNFVHDHYYFVQFKDHYILVNYLPLNSLLFLMINLLLKYSLLKNQYFFNTPNLLYLYFLFTNQSF